MKGVGTDEDTLIEIIVSRPTPILKMIKAAYKNKYGKELEDAIDISKEKHIYPFKQSRRY